jgi:hypothetical protein
MRNVGQKRQSTHRSSWRNETVQNLEEKKAGQSSGQTEGQINRHKTLKRALFGRANTMLLRPRLLPIGAVANAEIADDPHLRQRDGCPSACQRHVGSCPKRCARFLGRATKFWTVAEWLSRR